MSSRASASASSSKASFIPALSRRREDDDAAAKAAARDSVNERLARSRLAARPRRRQQQELEDPLCHPSSTSSPPPPPPSKPTFSAAPSSSSSHSIGLKVLSAIEAKETDRQAAAKASALRRMFAGPAPPQSWSGSPPSSSSSAIHEPLSTSLPQPLIVPFTPSSAPHHALTIRPHMLFGLVQKCRERDRQRMEPWASTRPGYRRKDALPSLKLITAAYIVDLLHHVPSPATGRVDETARTANEMREELPHLPRHAKMCIMEAAGTRCLSWRALDFVQTGVWNPRRTGLSTIYALWPGSDAHREKGGTTLHNGILEIGSIQIRTTESSDGSGTDGDDNWEVDSPDDGSRESLSDQLQVDLAWSYLPTFEARALLNPGAHQNTRLRSLNLAGMKLSDDFLYHVIQYGFPNLEELCLAGCYLSRDRSLPMDKTHGRLRRFWVTCPKLKLLDLSYASPCLAMAFADGLLAASVTATSLKPTPRYATELTDALVKGCFPPGVDKVPHETTDVWRRRCASAPIPAVESTTSRVKDCSVSASHARLRDYDEDKLQNLEAVRGTRAPYWTSARHAEWALLFLPRARSPTRTVPDSPTMGDFASLHGEEEVSSLPPALLPVHAPDIYAQFADPARDYMGTGEVFCAVFRNYLGTQVDIWT